MKANDDLFRLIISMSKSEKRHFKIYAGKKEVNYVNLFDAISSMKEYDEVVLKNKFRDKKFIENLAYNKNYLFNLILESLTIFHSEDSSFSRTMDMINKSYVLLNKKLIRPARKQITRAVKSATEYELNELLLIALSLQLRSVVDSGRPKELDEETKKIFEEQKRLLNVIKNNYRYNELHSEFFTIFKRTGAARREKDLKKLSVIMSDELYQDENKALSFDAKNKYYQDWIHYMFQTGDLAKALSYSQKFISFIELNPVILSERKLNFRNALSNLVNLNRLLKNKSGFEESLMRLRDFDKQSFPDSEISVFKNNFLEMSWSIENLEFERAERIQLEFEELIKKHSDEINKTDPLFLSNVYFKSAELFFIQEKYDKALKFINCILNMNEKYTDYEYYSLSKILNLIIQFELNNFDYIEYNIKSVSRYFKNSGKAGRFEETTLNFLTRITVAKKERDKIQLCKKLKNELQLIKSKKFENTVLNSFDFISWIESHIKDLPMRKIIEQKRTAKF